MKKPVEVIQGDKSLRLTFYVIIALYLLLLISIEPVIDLILQSIFDPKNPDDVLLLDKVKLVTSTLIYTVVIFIPASFSSWYGYRVISSSKLPAVLLSGKTHFPFTVVVIKGKQAKMFGVLIIIVSLLLIFQLVLNLVKAVFIAVV